jgi:hypothetical protein
LILAHLQLVQLGRQHFPKLHSEIIVDPAFQRAAVPFYPCDIRDDSIGKPDEMYIALGMSRELFFFLFFSFFFFFFPFFLVICRIPWSVVERSKLLRLHDDAIHLG